MKTHEKQAQFIHVGDVIVFGKVDKPRLETVTANFKYDSDEVCICTTADADGTIWYRHTLFNVTGEEYS